LRVTADTNILISALNFGGTPERFLRLAEMRAFQLVISEAILAEVAKVLREEKFAWPEPEISKALEQLFAERVLPSRSLEIVQADPDENRILECAEAGEVDYIVSGDKHLLGLKQFADVPIMKVADFMERFQAIGETE
jgi:uncharacterized protein